MQWDTDIFLDALGSSALLNGALITIALAVTAWFGAQAIGAVLAVGRTSRFRAVRGAVLGYLWFFRAVPLLLQLLFVWNALPQLIPSLKSAVTKMRQDGSLAEIAKRWGLPASGTDL